MSRLTNPPQIRILNRRAWWVSPAIILIGFGILIEAGLIVMLLTTGIYRGNPYLPIMYWLPFGVYMVCVYWISRREKGSGSHFEVRVVIGFSIVFNLTILLSPYPLSDDVFRYHWDGRILSQGVNPYQYSPLDVELEEFRDSNWEKIQNKDVKTMYPPLSLAIFSIAAKLLPGILGLRVVSILFSLLSTRILTLILGELKRDIRLAVIFAWSPLVVIEFANSGHFDCFAIFFCLLSFLMILRGKYLASAFSLALAVLGKMYPLFFVPILFRKWKMKGVLLFVSAIFFAYLPYFSIGIELFSGAAYYFQWSTFNGGFSTLLFLAFRSIIGIIGAMALSRISIWALVVGFIGYLSLQASAHGNSPLRLLKYCYWIVGLYLLFAPALHPWYLTWILPFICLFPSPGWILFTGTSILARTVYIDYEVTGVWRDVGWLRLVEYLPVYCLLLVEFITQKSIHRGRLSRLHSSHRGSREYYENL